MKYTFIVNPVAGGCDKTEYIASEVAKHLKGENCEVIRSEYPGHAVALSAKLCLSAEKQRVFACGGDGTLNEVIRGICGNENISVGMIPCGTGNDFVRIAGNTDRELFSVANIKNLVEYLSDIILVNGIPCLNITSAGFDCETAAHVHKFSKLGFLSKQAYNISLIYCFFNHFYHNFTIRVDGGEKEEGRYIIACVANGNAYGGGYIAAPEAHIGDGYIDLVTAKNISRLKALPMIAKFKSGRHIQNGKSVLPFVEFRRCRKVKIEAAEPIYINIDGEIIKARNPEFELKDKQVGVLLPDAIVARLKTKDLERV